MEWNAPGAERKRSVRKSVVSGAWFGRACILLPAPEALPGWACTALEQAQPLQLAEVPLAPKQEGSFARLRLTTKAGTLEIQDADHGVLDQVLRMILHAE